MNTVTTKTTAEVRADAGERISGKRLKAIFIGSAGNLVEWFDFYCYSAFALYFASSFFPKQLGQVEAGSNPG